MAMTKAEQKRMADLESDLVLAKALRWPDYKPLRLDAAAIAAAKDWGDVTAAWWFNAHNLSVGDGCFSSNAHSTHGITKTTTQQVGGPWFETKRDALMALRIEMTMDAAKKLARIDALIAQEPAP